MAVRALPTDIGTAVLPHLILANSVTAGNAPSLTSSPAATLGATTNLVTPTVSSTSSPPTASQVVTGTAGASVAPAATSTTGTSTSSGSGNPFWAPDCQANETFAECFNFALAGLVVSGGLIAFGLVRRSTAMTVVGIAGLGLLWIASNLDLG